MSRPIFSYPSNTHSRAYNFLPSRSACIDSAIIVTLLLRTIYVCTLWRKKSSLSFSSPTRRTVFGSLYIYIYVVVWYHIEYKSNDMLLSLGCVVFGAESLLNILLYPNLPAATRDVYTMSMPLPPSLENTVLCERIPLRMLINASIPPPPRPHLQASPQHIIEPIKPIYVPPPISAFHYVLVAAKLPSRACAEWVLFWFCGKKNRRKRLVGWLVTPHHA